MNKSRILSIDILRGFIMIIMALDHTRDYFNAAAFHFDPLDLNKASIFLFFTRWVTHFCAPIFVLLAGTSAFLSGQRKTKKQLAGFLVRRGIWLVILELTIVNFAWFFNIEFPVFLFGVIWILGLAMIFLAALIFLPRNIILLFGLLLIFGHNLLDPIHMQGHDSLGFVWGMVHEAKIFFIGHVQFMEYYHLIPWVGVMAVGYYLGAWFSAGYDPKLRKKLLLRLGIGCWIVFVILRAANVYGNLTPYLPQPSALRSFLSFINISKYPPSLDYLLITEGFAFIFLSLTENISNRVTAFISVFGRVPLFFYLIHLYLIHIGAVLAAGLTGHGWHPMISMPSWLTDLPYLKQYGFSLPVTYLIWTGVILILYPMCKTYDRYKMNHREKWWLSYL